MLLQILEVTGLHGDLCYLHVASQSLTPLFKISLVLTFCIGSCLLGDVLKSQVLAFEGKNLKYCTRLLCRPAAGLIH